MNCRHCHTPLSKTFIDLGEMPPSNSYLVDRTEAEIKYPLRVLVCGNCFLVQTEDFVDREEMFSKEYAYFSSMSKSFLKHSKEYVEMITEELQLDEDSKVMEIACNDGYLLQYFLPKKMRIVGIEPTESTAKAAAEKGIPIIIDFFSLHLSHRIKKSLGTFNLIIGNNVLAHVPDVNDFLSGVQNLLGEKGVATFEFPYLLNLILLNQFDTIYHEHYSYYSLTAVQKIAETNGLQIHKVEEIPTHGGSLRVYLSHKGNWPIDESVESFLHREKLCRLDSLEFYENFQGEVEFLRAEFETFLKASRGKKIAGYGAAAKANTFLNYMGATDKTLPFIADVTPAKQGKFMPGSRIPIVGEDRLKEFDADYVIIFPWNFKDEIITRLKTIVGEHCQFVTFIPSMAIHK